MDTNNTSGSSLRSFILVIVFVVLFSGYSWFPKVLAMINPELSNQLQGFEAIVNLVFPFFSLLFAYKFQQDFLSFMAQNSSSPQRSSIPMQDVEKSYYKGLQNDCERYDLEPLDEDRATDNARLSLSEVYTDQYVTPALRSDEKRKEVHQGGMVEEKKRPLIPALAEYEDKHFIISGIVGTGKTCFVDYLTTEIIRSRSSNQSSHLPGFLAGRPVVRLRLRRLGAGMTPETSPVGFILKHVRKQVEEHVQLGCKAGTGTCNLSEQDIAGFLDDFIEKLRVNGVLLLDGLDEVSLAGNKRRTIQKAVENLLEQLPHDSKSKIIMTSRPVGLESGRQGYLPAGFVRLELAEMNMQQAEKFISHWYAMVLASGSSLESKKSAEQRAEHLIGQIKNNASLEDLIKTPLLLTLMLIVDYGNHRLPESRSELYARAVNLLLQRWHKNLQQHIDGIEPQEQVVLREMAGQVGFVGSLHKALSLIAVQTYKAVEDRKNKDAAITFSEEQVLQSLGQVYGRDVDCGAIRWFLQHRSNIFVGIGEEDSLQFIHKSFHEYLASQQFSFSSKACKEMRQMLNSPVERDWWREVILFWMNDRTLDELRDFIIEFFGEPVESKSVTFLENHADIVSLCCKGILDKKLGRSVAGEHPDQELVEFYTKGQKILLALMQHEGLSPKARAQAGRRLGELGDPRRGVTVQRKEDVVPDIDWITISSGTFIMGTDDDKAYSHETPAHKVRVQPFCMSRYLITNRQFRCFIEDGGYEKQKYWNVAGAEQWLQGELVGKELLQTIKDKDLRKRYIDWLKNDTVRSRPRFWHENKWGNPNHPVVGVSWYEAMAFCCWLGEVQGKKVTLPSEVEWEYAARGVKGLVYSWGDEPEDGMKGNIQPSGIGQTTAVGLFKPGKAVDGQGKRLELADMSGNVWEWTASRWGRDVDKPLFQYAEWSEEEKEQRNDPSVMEYRVTRGGSWSGNAGYARCSIRGWLHPVSRLSYLGFRVVFSLA